MRLTNTDILKTREVFWKLGECRIFVMLTEVGHSFPCATSDVEDNTNMLQFPPIRNKGSRTVLASIMQIIRPEETLMTLTLFNTFKLDNSLPYLHS